MSDVKKNDECECEVELRVQDEKRNVDTLDNVEGTERQIFMLRHGNTTKYGPRIYFGVEGDTVNIVIANTAETYSEQYVNSKASARKYWAELVDSGYVQELLN